MKIGFFIPSVGRGGVESSLAKLLHSLSGSDLELVVLYGEAPDDWLDSIKEVAELIQLKRRMVLPFTARIFGERASDSVGLLGNLKRYLRRRDLDVLVGYQSGAVALFARWWAGVDTPVIVRESNVPSIAYEHESSKWTFLKKRIKSLAFSRADAVVAVCQGASDDLVENFGVPDHLIEIIYNPAIPADIEFLRAEKIKHPWFDESSNIPILCSVGRLANQKDIPTTLRAVAEISKSRDVRLVLVGEGPLKDELQSLAVELGIGDNVWFAGHQTNPYKFMAQSRVFVLTSIYEGIANVLAEALASGVPVVATDCPTGPMEVLLDGRAGMLVPVGDILRVADAIQQSMDDTSKNDTFREGIAESVARFQPEVAAKVYIDLVQKLIS